MPGAFDVLGLALGTNATLRINGGAPWRKGEYFRREVTVANGSGPVWRSVSVTATGETTVSGNVFVPRTPEAFTYDADGNLTQDGRWTYTWDLAREIEHRHGVCLRNAGPLGIRINRRGDRIISRAKENRLVKAESRSTTPLASRRKVEWQYDALGRRIRQTTCDGTSGSWVVTEDLKFVSDPVLFGRHIAELNATNNALVRSYVWGLDLSGSLDGAGGVGGLLFVTQHSTPQPSTHFVCYDGNGNILALIAASDGSESARYESGPFGEPLRVTGPMAKENPYRFCTKRTDNTTDFVLYEYRAYNASTGRWPNRDLIEEQGGMHLYAYAFNDAVIQFDSDGRFTGTQCAVCGEWYQGWHKCVAQPVNVYLCVRDIDKNGADCLSYCELTVANIRGHGFLALKNDQGAIVDTRGSRFTWGKRGDGPWQEPEPVKPRACSRCLRTQSRLQHGSGAENGKTGETATESEIWECITGHKLTRDYNGLLYNCNDWVREAAEACGIHCPRRNHGSSKR